MKYRKSVAALTLILVGLLLFSPAYGSEPTEKISETAEYIMSAVPNPSPGSVGGEWAIIGIHRAQIEKDFYFDTYLKNLETYVAERGGDLGNRYTEYSRIALALGELSKTDLYDFTVRLEDYERVVSQGLNGAVFALEALAELGNTDADVCDKYVDFILNMQNKDGSFGLSPGTADVDVTAMTISALCLFDGDLRTDRAINRGFLYLSSVQHTDGGFSPSLEDEISCETTAQVIIAMKRYGLPENNKFFVKNGNTPSHALDLFRKTGGAYSHIQNGEIDPMATEQALLAMTEPESGHKTLIYDRLWFEANQEYLKSVK